MNNPTPKPKESRALLRFEVICHIKTLRAEGLPLAECLRAAASRPWPTEDGRYYSYRTLETWWYDYAQSGYDGIAGKARRRDAGRSRALEERLIQTIQRDFELTLRMEGNHVHGLAELNTAFARWIATNYHLRKHSATGQSPHERFTANRPPIRQVEDPANIDPLFHTRTERVARKDGTVTLGKKLFEVDLSLRALKVELRYNPLTFDPVEVWRKDSFHGLARRCNLHLNSQHFHKGDNYAR